MTARSMTAPAIHFPLDMAHPKRSMDLLCGGIGLGSASPARLMKAHAISPPMLPPRKTIVLVGMMGAGKSAVGRKLAAALGLPFHDADSEIERAAGCSVNEIFEQLGETAFRDGERKVIARLLEGPPHVLATGGGAFIDTITRERIKRNATSVWLKADLDLLVERVSRKQTRPLLKNGNPRDILERLLRERGPVYAEADLIVESGNGQHEAVVEQIVAQLEQRAGI